MTLKDTNVSKKIFIFALCITLMMSVVLVGYAAPLDNISQKVTEGLQQILKLVYTIAIPAGLIAIAWGGIQIFFGGTKAAEQGKALIIRVVIALAIIYGAKLIITTVANWMGADNVVTSNQGTSFSGVGFN